MDCGKVEKLLPYLDNGEMDANTEAAVRAHLEHCDNCLHTYEEQQRMFSLFDQAYRHDPDEIDRDFINGVTDRIARRRVARRSLRRYVAAAVIVMFVGSAALIRLSLFTGEKPALDMISEVGNSELDTYVASQYMDTRDLHSMIASTESDTEDEIIESMITDRVVDMTAEDIILTLDDNELALMYAAIE